MIKIIDVQLRTSYTWDDVKKRSPTWLSLKNECINWGQLIQTTLINQQVDIEVDLVENNWAGVAKLYSSWQDIKNSLSTWQELKDF